MWETLGISPTADPVVIRRAYVALLRGIDVDREPAAFIRLREAYESALAASAIQETPGFVFALGDVAPADAVYQERHERDAVDSAPDPSTELATLLADHRLTDAWRTYNRFMASGAIGLDDQRRLAAMVVTAALQDADVTMDTFLAMVALLGPEDILPDDLTVLRNDAAAKVAASRWLEGLRREAAGWAFGKRKYRVRAARRLLGKQHTLRGSWQELKITEALLDEYRIHAAWLAAKVDDARVTTLSARLQVAIARRTRFDTVWMAAFVIFIVLAAIWANFFAD